MGEVEVRKKKNGTLNFLIKRGNNRSGKQCLDTSHVTGFTLSHGMTHLQILRLRATSLENESKLREAEGTSH